MAQAWIEGDEGSECFCITDIDDRRQLASTRADHGRSSERVNASALAADGTSFALELGLTDTILFVKHTLSTMSEMGVRQQSIYLIDDTRQMKELELRDDETIGTVKGYGTSDSKLRFAVMLGLRNDDVAEFVQTLSVNAQRPDVTLGQPITPFETVEGGVTTTLTRDLWSCHDRVSTEGSDPSSASFDAKGVAFVPAHPELLIVTAFNLHQIRVYNCKTCLLLCATGERGAGDGQFNCPWGVVLSTDGEHVVVSDKDNHRLQVYRLVVQQVIEQHVKQSGGGSSVHGGSSMHVQLEFVRAIQAPCGGRIEFPRGLSTRQVGEQHTVLVAESGGTSQVSEYNVVDGAFIGTFGAGQGSGDGQLYMPDDVAVVLASGEVAVADTFNHRVTIFDGQSRAFVRTFGTRSAAEEVGQLDGHGQLDGQLHYPTAITSDAHGNLLVVDRCTPRLQAFSAEGKHLSTTNSLGVGGGDSAKGLAWCTEGCYLGIANGEAHNILLWRSL
jgi:DNA-binding beta-propeller fold protein YncE